MSLDAKLMTGEYMHSFGHSVTYIRDQLYELAAATNNFDLIPDNYYGKNFRESLQRHFSERTLSEIEFKRRISCFIEEYGHLNEMIDGQNREKSEHSFNFQLIQIFAEQIRSTIEPFSQYLALPTTEEDYRAVFELYVPHLRIATLSINGLFMLRDIYESIVDPAESRSLWTSKHPEWNRKK